jgi:GR25 family glycosyltransferase involved in LPS biosynthesis
MKNINYYLDVIDIIYWINLDRSIERRNNMKNILKEIDIPNKRISATDANLYEYSDLNNLFINYGTYNRTKIEYAVLHSHLKTIDEFSQSPYETALIFEDDLSIEYQKYWDKKISDIIKRAPKDWDIIMLNYNTKTELNDEFTLNKDGTIFSCLSYMINKKGALKLMNQIKKNHRYILYPDKIQKAEDYIYSSLKTYVYKYPYFTYPISNDSTIHPSHLFGHAYGKVLAEKNWNNKYNKFILSDLVLSDKTNFFKTIIIFIAITIILFIKTKLNI